MYQAVPSSSSGDKLYYYSLWYRHSLQTAVQYDG